MNEAPHPLDYGIMSSDPGDASDDCIHEGESGPHEHRVVREPKDHREG